MKLHEQKIAKSAACFAFFLAVVGVLLRDVSGTPSAPTDNFKSSCGAFLADPPAAGFKKWSSPATWPTGAVPGVGANVTIPCGTSVLLDVPKVDLNVLRVMGHLKFLDDPALPSICLSAHFVIVEGQFTVGTEAKQFSQKAIITLTPNTEGARAPFSYTLNGPASALTPRDLGHKVFAVVGGQVNFHGLPGPRTMAVWCKLSATLKKGDTKVYLDTDVSAIWPVGFEIGVASTDYDHTQAEQFVITAVAKYGTAGSVVTLDRPAAFMHWGDAALSDGVGGKLDQCAEVALLTRRVVMTGTDEPAPYQYEGGHFMVFFTQAPQFIEGLESVKMGQQGTLGRYPLHFHFHGSQTGGTYVRKNAVRCSKQRCVVIHATFNVTVFDNVAFNTSGHCFIVEEGGESGNVFEHNLGMRINAVDKVISADETDFMPAVFWISNMNNHFIDNVAAGSVDSGFWFELRNTVRGASLTWDFINYISPFRSALATFKGNTAHSCHIAGVRTYPHGSRPRVNYNPSLGAVPTTFSNLNIFKNGWGIFVHNSDNLMITNSTLADNDLGVAIDQDEAITVQMSKFIALSGNIGSPSTTACASNNQWSGCRPVTGCSMPLAAGQVGRSVSNWRDQPTMGVVINLSNRTDCGLYPITVKLCSFANYDPKCRQAAAVAMVGNMRSEPGNFWNAGHSLQGLKFDAISNRMWALPKTITYLGWMPLSETGEQYQFYAMKDADGSVIGKPGYIISNNSNMLPPAPATCTFNSAWNGYACPGVCFRTVQIDYREPTFESVGGQPAGKFSCLKIVRVQDNKVITIAGNVDQQGPYQQSYPDSRFFAANLVAGYTYQIIVTPGSSNPNFYPTDITITIKDSAPCSAGITFRVPAKAGQQWNVPSANKVVPSPCPGSAALPADFVSWQVVCVAGTGVVEAALGAQFTSALTLSCTPTPTTCSSSSLCGLVASGSSWLYDDSGKSQAGFANPLFTTTGWKTGSSVFGWLGYSNWVATALPLPTKMVYYFRKAFTVKSSACFSALNLEWAVSDGAVFYLNNREIGRYNMPAGAVTFSTKASTQVAFLLANQTSLIWNAASVASSLVEGSNVLAVEVHSFATYAWTIGFELRVTALMNTQSCTGSVKAVEVCDGIDNDNNGKVDDGPDGLPLTQPCKTACGSGVATCLSGEWQGCTAPPASEEKCNGKDDNCDGLVDNGMRQLDCAAGLGCFKGQCLPITNLSLPLVQWGQNSSGWRYYDQGGDLDAVSPFWRSGVPLGTAGWKVGTGPFGYDTYLANDTFTTTLNNIQGKSATHYFLKDFTLTAADVANTYKVDFGVRKDDGVVVYLNGQEISRINMPAGAITSATFATFVTQQVGAWESKWPYYPCTTCGSTTGKLLKAGTNWIAAEVHQSYLWSGDAAFDMSVQRHQFIDCKTLPGAPSTCIRQPPPTTLFSGYTNWQYSDASLPLPPANWTAIDFSDASWKTGRGVLGYGSWSAIYTKLSNATSAGQGQATYYFRRSFSLPDGPCFYDMTHSLLANDGAVVYLNGMEVYRHNMPDGPVSATSYAANWGSWTWKDYRISGGWLRAGTNVMAVEVHQYKGSNADGFFDSNLVGVREGATCLPSPP